MIAAKRCWLTMPVAAVSNLPRTLPLAGATPTVAVVASPTEVARTAPVVAEEIAVDARLRQEDVAVDAEENQIGSVVGDGGIGPVGDGLQQAEEVEVVVPPQVEVFVPP